MALGEGQQEEEAFFTAFSEKVHPGSTLCHPKVNKHVIDVRTSLADSFRAWPVIEGAVWSLWDFLQKGETDS